METLDSTDSRAPIFPRPLDFSAQAEYGKGERSNHKTEVKFMDEKKSFGEYIRRKRLGIGMTQRELAQALYVTESSVSKWERRGSLR